MQLPWGRASDRVGRRVPFIVLGTILSALLFLLIAASASPWQLIFVVLFQAIAISMVAPNWSALLGEKTVFGARGRVFGKVSVVGGITSLGGTLLAAVIVLQAPQTSAEGYHEAFLIAAIAGVASALVVLLVREAKATAAAGGEKGADPAREAERRRDFYYFTKVQAFYNFFMSLSWPLIPITVAVVLGASNLDIVMITVVSALSTIVLQSQVGRLLDRVGPVALIQASRWLFVIVPLAYGLANNLFWIYLISALMGVPTAIVNISFNAYILDVAPRRKNAEYFGVFNGVIGVVTFVGSLLGGYAARALQDAWAGNVWLALLVVYLVSFVGRGVGAYLCMRIRDPASYPESANAMWRRFEARVTNGSRSAMPAPLAALRSSSRSRKANGKADPGPRPEVSDPAPPPAPRDGEPPNAKRERR